MRSITSVLDERPLEIVLDHAERMCVLDRIQSRELAPQEQRGLAHASQRGAHVDIQLAAQQRGDRVLASRLTRHAHVVLHEGGRHHAVVDVHVLEMAAHLRR